MSAWQLRRVADTLRRGGLVVYPTEAVWGLGCDPADEAALERLLLLKRRPWHKGLILIAADFAQLEPWLTLPAPPAEVAREWPGHLTALLPARREVSPLLRGHHHRLAVRVSAHPPVRELCQAFGGAIVSTSANRSGAPATRRLLAVRRQLGRGVDAYWPAPLGAATRPSRIMDPDTGELLRL